jgi:tripartite-type tricarboxylate transporter receptor subunit TctC
MNLPRRQFLHLAAGAFALPTVSRIARAQTYPSRPVRLIVPFAPGGSSDILARLIGQWMTERLGQAFVVENRPGAGTNIGTEAGLHSPPDAYTLLMISTSTAINATLYPKLNFNLIRDMAPIALVRGPFLMVVNSSSPINTVLDFIAYAKANPGKISMASSGIGSGPHMTGELFKMMAGVDLVHVPYRGEAPALTDLIGDQVQVIFSSTPPAIEYIRTGRLRALAVTGASRLAAIANIPTVSEIVPGYEASAWWGVGAPMNIAAGIIDKLNKEINLGLADSKLKARFDDLGGTAFADSPADFNEVIVGEIEKWGKVVKFAGIKPV